MRSVCETLPIQTTQGLDTCVCNCVTVNETESLYLLLDPVRRKNASNGPAENLKAPLSDMFTQSISEKTHEDGDKNSLLCLNLTTFLCIF